MAPRTKSTTTEVTSEVVPSSTEKAALAAVDIKLDREMAIARFLRDGTGLLKNITYLFKEDGTIDWKLMIPDKYIVVNKEFFERNNIATPTSAEGLEDKQKLVLLGGIKEIAKIRGLISVEKKIWESSNDRAVVSCKIVFAPNYETDMKPLVYEEVASATLNNTNSFSQLFLETIASNRAFVRAVRNALRIDILGSDELSGVSGAVNNENSGSENEPWHALRDAAQNAVTKKYPQGFKNFEEFKAALVEKAQAGAAEWNEWKDIPTNTIFNLISQLKKTSAANK